MKKEIQERLEHEAHEHSHHKILQQREVEQGLAQRAQFFKNNEKHMKTRGDMFRKNRRQFLDFMGRTGIAGGVFKAFPAIAGVVASRQALAADEDTKRLALCYINSGAPNGYWLPKSVSEMNMVTEPYLGVADICQFREIDAAVEGHARGTQALGARSYGQPTTDTLAAPVLSANTPFSNMFLGSEPNGMDISAFGKPKADPQVALKDYFSSGAGNNDGPDTSYIGAYQAQMRALEQIKSKLSVEERDRLDEHSAAIAKIEKRITDIINGASVDPASCAPTLPTESHYIHDTGTGTEVKMVAHGKTMVDIIIAGMKCGLMNVATLQLGADAGGWKTHGVDHYGGFASDSHGSLHAGYTTEDGVPISFVECHRYLNQVPAYFIQQLIDNNGPDGKPLIDTTVFGQTTCMGNGMDHSTPNAPFILATRRADFQVGFSAKNMTDTASTYDFNETILKGLGIPGDFPSTTTLDLL